MDPLCLADLHHSTRFKQTGNHKLFLDNGTMPGPESNLDIHRTAMGHKTLKMRQTQPDIN